MLQERSERCSHKEEEEEGEVRSLFDFGANFHCGIYPEIKHSYRKKREWAIT